MDNDQFNIILSRLDKIDKDIIELKKTINQDIKNNCDKMGDHIDFIEKVYDTIKSPMYYICDKVSGVKPLTEEERRQLE
jgi:hypothetical protein|tara:strand:+ start:166 stop:402 length:237 start_codon:yes stop_codon:yes gene_type:complete